ncbi:hypothetical protein [Streptomyces sp. NPDC059708]|uniref:hypothetical protein n=1 Tax=Streptomyces sp. NPDC059708 TaxID=3346916 RepID=UPI00369DBD1C
MDIVITVLVVLMPVVDRVIRIAADRSRTRGEAEVIEAEGAADLARARGEAEVIRAMARIRRVRGRGRG